MNLETYEILESIGKGGMGEVFLAHDPRCGRDVALKKMAPKWVEKPIMRERFLREAKIAAQLNHPNIIPIFAIDEAGTSYTMPRIEGETLKEIIRETKEQIKKGEPVHQIGSSVPALVRIFLSVCSAIAYAHSRGVLHRDLKPENIIVGKFGEVIILDWGLADFIDRPEKGGFDYEGDPHLTQPGKIPGTLLFMAPERALGARSSPSTDIYSLGVMLYQLLTLQFPFRRPSLQEFKKRHKHEEILPPEEVAPDRDIPPYLSDIAKKCLEKDPKDRYGSVEEMIKDLESYIEGRPEWIAAGILDHTNGKNWQFQENVALTKHQALSRGFESLEWVNLMISEAHFPGSIQIKTEFTLHADGQGAAILFCVPEIPYRKAIEEAYVLWLKPEGIELFRSNVRVAGSKKLALEVDKPYRMRIEQIETTVTVYLDDTPLFSFFNHIPLSGTQVGLFLRDTQLSFSPLQIAAGSQNILVNCLAVPDAFLARKQYDIALQEYRKISHSFPGRAEGREATFRAGTTLLKQGLFSEANEEFEKLHNTPGAPLEYLGKSLCYKAQSDLEEEVKCLELAIRKFPSHPLKPILVEYIFSRLFETSQSEREGAYRFALLTLCHLPRRPELTDIIELLENFLEILPFFTPSKHHEISLIIQLAFWLDRPMPIIELLKKDLDDIDRENAQIALSLLEKKDPPKPPEAYFVYLLLKGENPAPALSEGAPLDLFLYEALLRKEWEKAAKLMAQVPAEHLSDENSPFFFLYGCYLKHTAGEEEAKAHLTNCSVKAYPPTTTLLSHYLMGQIGLEKGWIERAFPYEIFCLKQQLHIFCDIAGSH